MSVPPSIRTALSSMPYRSVGHTHDAKATENPTSEAIANKQASAPAYDTLNYEDSEIDYMDICEDGDSEVSALPLSRVLSTKLQTDRSDSSLSTRIPAGAYVTVALITVIWMWSCLLRLSKPVQLTCTQLTSIANCNHSNAPTSRPHLQLPTQRLTCGRRQTQSALRHRFPTSRLSINRR